MAESTKIQWCDHTFNPWRGCTKVSAGCANCYAETLSARNPGVLGVWGANGTRVVASESQWKKPLKWDRQAAKDGVRRKVFCASLADVFEDWRGPIMTSTGGYSQNCYDRGGACGVTRFHGVPLRGGTSATTMDDVRRRMFALIDETQNLDWLLLTKRPENILRMQIPLSAALCECIACCNGDHPGGCSGCSGSGERDGEQCATCCGSGDCQVCGGAWYPDAVSGGHSQDELYRRNLWLGTSIEDQATAEERVRHLLKCRYLSPVLWLSVEPLLGPVDLTYLTTRDTWTDVLNGQHVHNAAKFQNSCPTIDWVVVGGESGPNARPCNVDWIQSIVRQCAAAGAPCFVKQIGSYVIGSEDEAHEPRGVCIDKKGGDPSEWPEDIRVRQWPEVMNNDR